MKKHTALTFLVFISFSVFAQLPKGDRIMAWQVDMVENLNYDSSFAFAELGCMESAHVTFGWSSIEPDSGNFDMDYIHNILDVANFYYPAKGTKLELQIPTMNTVVKTTPADLMAKGRNMAKYLAFDYRFPKKKIV